MEETCNALPPYKCSAVHLRLFCLWNPRRLKIMTELQTKNYENYLRLIGFTVCFEQGFVNLVMITLCTLTHDLYL